MGVGIEGRIEQANALKKETPLQEDFLRKLRGIIDSPVQAFTIVCVVEDVEMEVAKEIVVESKLWEKEIQQMNNNTGEFLDYDDLTNEN